MTKPIENEVIEIPDSDSDVEETVETVTIPEVTEIQSPKYEQHIPEFPMEVENNSTIPSSSVDPQIFETEIEQPQEEVMVEVVFDGMGNLQNVSDLSNNNHQEDEAMTATYSEQPQIIEEILPPIYTEQSQIIEDVVPSSSLPAEIIEAPFEEETIDDNVKNSGNAADLSTNDKESNEEALAENDHETNLEIQEIEKVDSREVEEEEEIKPQDTTEEENNELESQFEVLPSQKEDEEIQKILDNALESEEDIVSHSHDKTKTTKSAKKTRQSKRAASVPLKALTPPKKIPRLSRAASELRALNESVEQFEGVLTRKKSQLLRSRETTPVTPKMVSSEELNVTPRRMATRAYSRDSVDSAETPEKPGSVKKTPGRKKANETLKPAVSLESLNESIGSRRSTRSQSINQQQSDDSESVSSSTSQRIARKRSTPKRFSEDTSGRPAKIANKTKAAHEISQLSSIPEEESGTSRRGRKKIDFK